jgi:predicted PurR-regulated permease PerM
MSTTSTVRIDLGSVARVLLLVISLWLAYKLVDLVLVILTAIVIGASLEPFIRRFISWGVPRVLAVIFLYVGGAVAAGIIFYFFVPPLLGDLALFASNFPQYLHSLQISSTNIAPTLIEEASRSTNFSLDSALSEVVTRISSFAASPLSLVAGIFGGVLSFILIVVISFYLAVQERGIESFLRLVTPLPQEEYILHLWRRAEKKIGLWMQGQLLLAFIVGVLVYLGLLLLDVRYAFLLALIASIFELIPIFGPILAAVPAIAIGTIDGGLTKGLLVMGFYVIVQQFENQLFSPLVVRKVVGVPPIISIIALIAGAELAGFWGLILAVPLAAIFIEFLEDFDRKKASMRDHGR